MIKKLVSLQFMFLFCPIYIISLVVFGSDFRGLTGWFYLTALIVIFILHFSSRFWLMVLSETLNRMILFIAVIIGLLAYRQLHFGVWDEHSLSQAISFSVFAVLSYLGSVIATYADDSAENSDKFMLAKVLLVYALFYVSALAYPHSLFFFVALLLGLALIYLSWSSEEFLRREIKYRGDEIAWERYLVFVLTLDMALVVWDYKVNTLWASYLAISFFGAALGALIAQVLSNKFQMWLMVLLISNILLAVVFPTYILNVGHSFILGFGSGLLLTWSFYERRNYFYHRLSNLWPFMLLGLIFSYAFYVHLSLTYWRSVFVIPLLYLAIKTRNKIKANISTKNYT